jgi:hypothetical protein
MSDRDALRLIEHLAQFVMEYGHDCEPEMTIEHLAHDLASSNGTPALTPRFEEALDAVRAGLKENVSA